MPLGTNDRVANSLRPSFPNNNIALHLPFSPSPNSVKSRQLLPYSIPFFPTLASMNQNCIYRWLLQCAAYTSAQKSSFSTPKLASFILLGILTCCIACSPIPPRQEIVAPQNTVISYCANEIILIQDSSNNWEVPVDSIDSIEDYHRLSRIQIGASTMSKDSTEYPNVHPYIVIDSINISLMHLLRPTGGGYSGHAGNACTVYYQDLIYGAGTHAIESIRDFHLKFDPYKKNEFRGSRWLIGPMVRVVFSHDSFADIKIAIKRIVTGYLQAMNILSLRFYNNDLCELNPSDLREMKRNYPLKIRLLNANY